MNISSLNAGSAAQSAQAAQAATPAPSADEKKAAEAARQFEAVMLRQVLGDALKPSPAAGSAAPKTPGADTYQSFVTDILADSISQSGALGLSHLLQLPTGKK